MQNIASNVHKNVGSSSKSTSSTKDLKEKTSKQGLPKELPKELPKASEKSKVVKDVKAVKAVKTVKAVKAVKVVKLVKLAKTNERPKVVGSNEKPKVITKVIYKPKTDIESSISLAREQKLSDLAHSLAVKEEYLSNKEKTYLSELEVTKQREILVKRMEESQREKELKIREKEENISEKEENIREKEENIREKEENIREKEENIRENEENMRSDLERHILLREKEKSFNKEVVLLSERQTVLKELELALRLRDLSAGSNNVTFSPSTYGCINKDGKILITGTGRAGTTFLIILFTLLGLSTGFTPENYRQSIFANCNSGMEKTRITVHAKIVKNPKFIVDIAEGIINPRKIGCVIMPLREYSDAAESRYNYKNKTGGLWNAATVNEQMTFYHKIISEYIIQMVRWSIPTIFLDFDKMVNSPLYLYQHLQPIIPGISYEAFEIAYKKATEDQKKPVAETR